MHSTKPSPSSIVALSVYMAATACGDDLPSPAAADSGPAASATSGSTSGTTGGEESSGTTGEPEQDRASVTHSFGVQSLGPREETEPCIQWTLHNEQAIYIEAVTLANDGGFHHSNWFVVPEEQFPGDDGFFDCSSRAFTELEAAVSGTVLTAQSTQSRYERMELPPGVVIKAPPHHKIIAGGHLLNLADADRTPSCG